MLKWLAGLFTRKPDIPGRESVPAIDELPAIIGYTFSDASLLVQALKHRSYLPAVNESRMQSNERLELLGDAVLGLVVTEALFQLFPEKEEGEITTMKSLLVSRKVLARFARDLNIGRFILLGESEDQSGGRHRPSILADAFEAIIGAVYLDGGLVSAKKFVENHLLVEMESTLAEEGHRNFKSMLLEYSQSQSLGAPFYTIRSQEGPDHDKLFTVEVKIQNQTVGIGQGHSKKRAEQQAAQNALEKIRR